MYSIDKTLESLHSARLFLVRGRGTDPLSLLEVARILKSLSGQEGMPSTLKSLAQTTGALAREIAERGAGPEGDSSMLYENIDKMISALRKQYWDVEGCRTADREWVSGA